MKEEIKIKYNRIKSHLRVHRTTYLAAAGGVVVGGLAVAAHKGEARIITDSFKFQWKSPTENHITTVLARRGHPGNIVRCVDTGEVYASQQRASEAMGISPTTLTRHLQGKRDHVNGHTFEILGEAS